MTSKTHWEGVYSARAANEVGWFKPSFDVSLELIAEASPERNARIIDIGGGASMLIDNLLARGYEHVTVLDIASAALEQSRQRLGDQANKVDWIVADARSVTELGTYDVWHDRAVFHFFQDPADRQSYVALAKRTIPIGGHVIICTFATDGPEKCSGLSTCRYSSESLATEFGDGFQPIKEVPEIHVTPSGKSQSFVYTMLKRA